MKSKRLLQVWVVLTLLLYNCEEILHAQDNRLAQGHALIRVGQFRAAKKHIDAVHASLNPSTQPLDFGEASFLLGKINTLMVYDTVLRYPHYRKALQLLKQSPQHQELCWMIRLDLNAVSAFEQLAKEPNVDALLPGARAYAYLALAKKNYPQESAQNFVKEAIMRYEKLPVHYQLGESYNLSGDLFRRKSRFQEALTTLEKAERVFKHLGGAEHNLLFLPYINRGVVFDEQTQISEAINSYNQAAEILAKIRPDHPNLTNLYNNLGNTYKKFGEYDLAEKSIKLAINSNPTNFSYYNNLANTYMDQEKFALAKSTFLHALNIGKKNLQTKNQVAEFARPNHSLAYVYRRMKKLDSAYYYAQIGLDLRKKSLDFIHIEVARSYLELAYCDSLSGRFDRAKCYLDTLILIHRRLPRFEHAELAAAFLLKAQLNAQNFQLRQKYLDTALTTVGYHSSDFQSILSPGTFIDILQNRAITHLQAYRQDRTFNHLQEAQQCFNLGVQAIPNLRAMLSEESSKAKLLTKYKSFLGLAIGNCLQLYQLQPQNAYLEAAFAFNEQDKSLNLLEGMLKRGINLGIALPPNLSEQDKQLLSRIRSLDKQLLETNSPKIRDELTKSRIEYSLFQSKIFNAYPGYYQALNEASKIPLAIIQQESISSEQALVEYFVADTTIYIFVLQQNSIRVMPIKKDFPLEQWVRELVEGLTLYHLSKVKNSALEQKTRNLYINASLELYLKLIEPVKTLLGSKSLVIIPSAELALLPFEILLSGAPRDPLNPKTYPYLLKDFAISYSYSATLFHEMKQKKHSNPPTNTMLAMAPFFTQPSNTLMQQFTGNVPDQYRPIKLEEKIALRGDLLPLKNSGEEAYALSTLFNGAFYVDTMATLKRFLQLVSSYRFLLLSTHGIINRQQNDFSFIAFASKNTLQNPAKLYLSDLYQLRLNADLVLLSACETGQGDLLPGEGIISLARAFAFAGAKSIGSSLWMADDLATRQITITLGQYLKQGMNKASAMRIAKLGYLEKISVDRAHPFFWAGLILIGDTNPLF